MSAANLVSWLRFRASPTHDESGDTWQAIGNPTVSNNKLILDGQSAIKLNGILLGGQSFTLDGWVYLDANNDKSDTIIRIANHRKKRVLLDVQVSRNDATKLELWASDYADCSVDFGHMYTTSASYNGQRVHFKVVYNQPNNRVRLYINDVSVLQITDRPAYQRALFDIYIGGLQTSSYLRGSVEEFRLYDGIASATGNGTTPTTADYDALAADFAALGEHVVIRPTIERTIKRSAQVTADFERKIKNAPLEWRYYNAGDVHDLTQTPTYLTNLPATKSTTGYAFYQTTRAKCFDLPASPQIWAKFDVYFDGSNRWRAYNGGSNGDSGVCVESGNFCFFVNQGASYHKQFSNVQKTNTLQTVLLHMVSGSSDGVVEAWVDGTKIYTYNGDVNHGDAFADFYLQSDGAGTFFSNVFISNEEIIPPTTMTFAIERRLINAVEATAAVERDLRRTTEVTATIERRLINEVQTTAAIERQLINHVTTTAAIERRVIKSVEETFAIERQIISRTITAEFAIERRLINPNIIGFDIERRVVRAEELTFDIERDVTFSGLLNRILPDSILGDSKFKASAIALDMQILAVFDAVKEVLHIPRLDELEGTILDLLAWQLHVDLYEPLYLSDEQKRSLIRQSVAWHRRKGTVAAVEELAAAVFKGATIQEWFDYGGEPYYFRIIAKSFAKSDEDYRTFRRAIDVAKNVRSHLDKIIVDFSPEEPLTVKVGFGRRAVTGTKRILRDKPKDLRLRIGIGCGRLIRTGHIGTILPPAPVEPMRLRIRIGCGRFIRTGNIRYQDAGRNYFLGSD